MGSVLRRLRRGVVGPKKAVVTEVIRRLEADESGAFKALPSHLRGTFEALCNGAQAVGAAGCFIPLEWAVLNVMASNKMKPNKDYLYKRAHERLDLLREVGLIEVLTLDDVIKETQDSMEQADREAATEMQEEGRGGEKFVLITAMIAPSGQF